MSHNVPTEEITVDLKTIVKAIEQEDTSVRERQIRQWRQLKYYWDGLNNIWWNEVAHDWQVFGQELAGGDYNDAAYYDKRINVLRAYLETIIAALSVTIPNIRCSPDDAESPLDMSTAKAGDKIAKLVGKHNNQDYLWLHALFVLVTEGLVFAYTYPKEDEKYGTYEEPIYKDVEEEAYICPDCGEQLPEDILASAENEFDPSGEIPCPFCDALLDPSLQKSSLIVSRLIGNTTKIKSRICIEIFGGLNVKIPNYVSNICETPYLVYSYETNYVNVRERYESLRNKDFDAKRLGPNTGGIYDPYEQWGRLSTQYLGEYPENTVTVRNVWLRPSAYHYLTEQDKISQLKEDYPDGCKIIIIDDTIVEAYNESLDDHWTCTKNPLSDYLHFQPMGMLLTSVQDITNEIISLTLQTIEHGIPQTFADPGVLNFKQYREMEVSPGQVIPAIPKSGKSVSDAFYEIKTATLSGEVLPFGESIQQLGQHASGALPSLSGGAQPNSSKTASQYLTSKNQAQQRLQITWKMLCIFWKETFSKVIPQYMKEIVEDERYVEKNTTGEFINVFIRKAELAGKIGDIELDAAENLPISWMQKKDTIMQFLQAANPAVMEALIDPQNLPVIAEAVGLDNLELPGENDRQVQLEEIVQLINSTPVPDIMALEQQMMASAEQELMTGMPQQEPEMPETSSVPIESDVDNHEIHIKICRNWLTSEAGRLAKTENESGYKNVLLHMKAHLMYLQQQMMMQQMMNPTGNEGKPEGKPGNDKVMAPAKDKMHETTS